MKLKQRIDIVGKKFPIFKDKMAKETDLLGYKVCRDAYDLDTHAATFVSWEENFDVTNPEIDEVLKTVKYEPKTFGFYGWGMVDKIDNLNSLLSGLKEVK